jgi:diguanylate cyclase (GGDEF)-like protein
MLADTTGPSAQRYVKGIKDQKEACVASNEYSVDERLVSEKVQLELASVFNDRLVASAYVSPLAIAFVGWLQTEAAGAARATAWVLLIVSAQLVVIGSGRALRNAVSNGQPVTRWLNAQQACCGVLGLLWGVATWFVWAPDKFLFYIITLCVLVGVGFSCMVVMAPMRRAMIALAVGLAIAPLLQLATIDNPVGREIGVGWVIMICVQLWYAKELRRESLRQIDSSVRNVILVARLTQVSQELTHTNSELNSAMAQLNQLVTFDHLTGAFSRRYFMEALDRAVAMHGRHGTPVSLIALDLDHFKQINDRWGHSAGDRALREAAGYAKTQLREGDILGRVGGEEFLILLPMTGRDAAITLAERMCAALAAVSIEEGSHTIRIPASFGVAELRPNEDAGAWLRRVDEAQYQAKNTGRNRVVAAA